MMDEWMNQDLDHEGVKRDVTIVALRNGGAEQDGRTASHGRLMRRDIKHISPQYAVISCQDDG